MPPVWTNAGPWAIESIKVRLRCMDGGDPMGLTACTYTTCTKCGGSGSYKATITWDDFIAAVKAELEPAPDSTR